jgi:hypothetical protein
MDKDKVMRHHSRHSPITSDMKPFFNDETFEVHDQSFKAME